MSEIEQNLSAIPSSTLKDLVHHANNEREHKSILTELKHRGIHLAHKFIEVDTFEEEFEDAIAVKTVVHDDYTGIDSESGDDDLENLKIFHGE